MTDSGRYSRKNGRQYFKQYFCTTFFSVLLTFNIRFMNFPLTWLVMALLPGQPQINVSETINIVATNLDGVTIGLSEKELLSNTTKNLYIDRSRGFRTEAIDSINQAGLANITYFFDADGNLPLYEFVVEFSDDRIRREAAFEMLGPANYPGESDQWILSMNDSTMVIAWAFDNKLVVASNLPGTEWEGSDLFKLPTNFTPFAHLAFPTTWPENEHNRFFASISKQISAKANGFQSIRGKPLETNPAYLRCMLPVSVAKSSTILLGDNGKYWICNNLVDGLNADDAVNWALDLGGLFKEYVPEDFKLVRTQPKKVIGLHAEIWDILDESGKDTGLQVGVICYEWGDEGLWNVDMLVMQK